MDIDRGKSVMARKERDIAKERYAVPLLVPVYPFRIEEWLRNERERESFS